MRIWPMPPGFMRWKKGLIRAAFPLWPFGGAGPVHAYQVAEKLRMETIIIPPGAGVCSSFGFLLAPMSFDLGLSFISRLEELPWERPEFHLRHARGQRARASSGCRGRFVGHAVYPLGGHALCRAGF